MFDITAPLSGFVSAILLVITGAYIYHNIRVKAYHEILLWIGLLLTMLADMLPHLPPALFFGLKGAAYGYLSLYAELVIYQHYRRDGLRGMITFMVIALVVGIPVIWLSSLI